MEWSTSATHLAVLVPVTIVIADTIRRYIYDRIEKKGYPLPPGPTPLPFVGNALSIDTKAPWLTYAEWQAKYGDIMHIRLLDTDMIVLNSYSVAMDLLEKRSQIYSDRPFVATIEPYGHDCNLAFLRYGDHWRLSRRIFHQTFRAEAAVAFRPRQTRRAREMIVSLIDEPEEYSQHYWTFSSAVAMTSVYDYEPKARNDPMVSAIHSFTSASFPEITPEKAIILKAFPFLLHIPDWFPGSWIKRRAREVRRLRDKAVEMPYQYAKDRAASDDTTNDAMVPNHIARMEKLDDSYRTEYEAALKRASITAFFGSADTTSSTITTFTLAMVKNPRIWKRAQAEIDAVLGTDRLPEFDDWQSLPYVEAILRETFRWKPVTPLSVPHATTNSDIYKGFYIPKGATIIANTWAMSYDEVRYPNPETFNPERFLDARGQLIKDDPREFIYGFGRRVCPGRHTANASTWIAIATMLAALEFNAAKDKDGNEIVFEPSFTSGVTLHPLKFPCHIAPRAHVTKETLERILAD